MAELVNELELLDGETVLDTTDCPFEITSPRLGMDLVIDMLTQDHQRMPWASIAIDDGGHQGIFDVEFPRDALIMSAFVADTMPEISEVTITRLCELQGLTDRTEGGIFADREEPGRIPHEVREADDPRAVKFTKSFGWQWPYFGAIDTTPLFIAAVTRAGLRRPEFLSDAVVQGDGVTRSVKECLVRSIDWLWAKLASSQSGLLETKAATNRCWQVWQDSPDAYHHVDGSLAMGTVAPVELQAYVYDALMGIADLAQVGHIPGDPNFVYFKAQRLRRAVLEHLWVTSTFHGGYFAAGLERIGRTLRPLAVRGANMAMLLNSRILEGSAYERYARALVEQLQTDSLMSSTGVRTLASDEKRFRPYGYHTGSVWPWQNVWIAQGLRNHGYDELALDIEHKIARIESTLQCAPEFVRGANDFLPQANEQLIVLNSPDGHGNTFRHLAMQPPQRFQGWSVFALYSLQASEGVKSALDVSTV